MNHFRRKTAQHTSLRPPRPSKPFPQSHGRAVILNRHLASSSTALPPKQRYTKYPPEDPSKSPHRNRARYPYRYPRLCQPANQQRTGAVSSMESQFASHTATISSYTSPYTSSAANPATAKAPTKARNPAVADMHCQYHASNKHSHRPDPQHHHSDRHSDQHRRRLFASPSPEPSTLPHPATSSVSKATRRSESTAPPYVSARTNEYASRYASRYAVGGSGPSNRPGASDDSGEETLYSAFSNQILAPLKTAVIIILIIITSWALIATTVFFVIHMDNISRVRLAIKRRKRVRNGLIPAERPRVAALNLLQIVDDVVRSYPTPLSCASSVDAVFFGSADPVYGSSGGQNIRRPPRWHAPLSHVSLPSVHPNMQYATDSDRTREGAMEMVGLYNRGATGSGHGSGSNTVVVTSTVDEEPSGVPNAVPNGLDTMADAYSDRERDFDAFEGLEGFGAFDAVPVPGAKNTDGVSLTAGARERSAATDPEEQRIPLPALATDGRIRKSRANSPPSQSSGRGVSTQAAGTSSSEGKIARMEDRPNARDRIGVAIRSPPSQGGVLRTLKNVPLPSILARRLTEKMDQGASEIAPQRIASREQTSGDGALGGGATMPKHSGSFEVRIPTVDNPTKEVAMETKIESIGNQTGVSQGASLPSYRGMMYEVSTSPIGTSSTTIDATAAVSHPSQANAPGQHAGQGARNYLLPPPAAPPTAPSAVPETVQPTRYTAPLTTPAVSTPATSRYHSEAELGSPRAGDIHRQQQQQRRRSRSRSRPREGEVLVSSEATTEVARLRGGTGGGGEEGSMPAGRRTSRSGRTSVQVGEGVSALASRSREFVAELHSPSGASASATSATSATPATPVAAASGLYFPTAPSSGVSIGVAGPSFEERIPVH